MSSSAEVGRNQENSEKVPKVSHDDKSKEISEGEEVTSRNERSSSFPSDPDETPRSDRKEKRKRTTDELEDVKQAMVDNESIAITGLQEETGEELYKVESVPDVPETRLVLRRECRTHTIRSVFVLLLPKLEFVERETSFQE